MASEKSKDPFGELLTDALARATSDPVQITVRALIGYLGARARGAVVVKRISERLSAAGLTTKPDFTVGSVDNTVTLVAAPSGKPIEHEDPFQEQFLRVHTLRSARNPVTSVAPNHSVRHAQTIMAMNDFSQLAVCATPRVEPQAISWESIGRARIGGEVDDVRNASVPAVSVAPTDDLLPLLPRIAEAGFVFVREHNYLVGVITATDVTEEFADLAGPFFLLGEIERRLRSATGDAFTIDEVAAIRDPSDSREVGSAADLSFGELQRLIEKPDWFNRLRWDLDRVAFLERVGVVRDIRNSFMHFSSDLPSREDVAMLRQTSELLKTLTPNA